MTRIALATEIDDCWNTIGVMGDRTCPELPRHVHCHNCPVFASAGRRFLDAASPAEYRQEWTERLASDVVEMATEVTSVLVFRIADEWLALRVRALVEVTTPRPVHRVPYRTGLLAGLINIRGELHLCVHLSKLLGIAVGAGAQRSGATDDSGATPGTERLLVVRREADSWVFPVDAVDRVCRVAAGDLSDVPATVGRAAGHFACGVFMRDGRTIGVLDEDRLLDSLRRKLR